MAKKEYAIERPYPDTGALLQKHRKQGELTQNFVSKQLGYCSAQFISNFERGISVPPTSKLAKLLKLLRLPLDDFMKVYTREDSARTRSEIMAFSRK